MQGKDRPSRRHEGDEGARHWAVSGGRSDAGLGYYGHKSPELDGAFLKNDVTICGAGRDTDLFEAVVNSLAGALLIRRDSVSQRR